jgi:hypothetical protein
MAQHIAAMNRLHYPTALGYLNADPRNSVTPLAHCNANHGQGFGQAEYDHQLWHLFHPLAPGSVFAKNGNCGGQGCKDGKCGGGGAGGGCPHCAKLHGQNCPHCGKSGFGAFGCPHCGHGVGGGQGHGGNGHGLFGGNGNGHGPGGDGAAGAGAFTPPYYSAYPGMNREDALRYIEGFQYFPPYQLIRSPRDFFMWDVRYNFGK